MSHSLAIRPSYSIFIASATPSTWIPLYFAGMKRLKKAYPRETLGQGQAILDFYARQGVVTLQEWVSWVNRMQVDALRLPFYSFRHARGSHVPGHQFDLGNTSVTVHIVTLYEKTEEI